MRARTHAAACDYGMSALGGPEPCTCGVSPASLTAEQTIRAVALDAAVHQAGGSLPRSDVIELAERFASYIRSGV